MLGLCLPEIVVIFTTFFAIAIVIVIVIAVLVLILIDIFTSNFGVVAAAVIIAVAMDEEVHNVGWNFFQA